MLAGTGGGDEEADGAAGGEDGRGGARSGKLILHTFLSLREGEGEQLGLRLDPGAAKAGEVGARRSGRRRPPRAHAATSADARAILFICIFLHLIQAFRCSHFPAFIPDL